MTRANAPDLAPTSARCAGLIRRAHAHCAGDDPSWDAWAGAVIDQKGLQNNAVIAMPIITDAFLRGLQTGLKAHVPIDVEQIEEAKSKFAQLTLRAYVRQESARAFAALSIDDVVRVNEACRNGEAALAKLGVS